MRLLLAVTELALGGAETVVLELARDAGGRGDDVAVAAARGPLEAELREAGATHFELPAPGRSPRALARATGGLSAAMRRFEPDVVHAHNPKIGALAALAARRVRSVARPALVTTHHGVPPAQERFAALALRASDHVVAVSEALQRTLVGHRFPPGRLTVIPNGVRALEPPTAAERARLRAELGGEGRPLVTAVGRLVPQKAHARLLDAAAALARDGVPARFVIVGDGPLRSELEERARTLGLNGAVCFAGLRRDARAIVACSELLVFASDWEGLSLAALEALAAGVPVVSTDVAGSGEVLSTGAGVVVAREPTAIAQAIAELLADDERRARMGEEGRRLHAERFSIESMVAAYRSVYDDRHNRNNA
jgi:glycosyltransferase involved in cell wall biosynthesis